MLRKPAWDWEEIGISRMQTLSNALLKGQRLGRYKRAAWRLLSKDPVPVLLRPHHDLRNVLVKQKALLDE
jgi:hypothetical protein